MLVPYNQSYQAAKQERSNAKKQEREILQSIKGEPLPLFDKLQYAIESKYKLHF